MTLPARKLEIEIARATPVQVTVPKEVTLAQARTVLRRAGLLTTVDTAIRNSGDLEMIDAWDYGNGLTRNSNMLNAMAVTLDLTEAQVDQLFVDAANVKY